MLSPLMTENKESQDLIAYKNAMQDNKIDEMKLIFTEMSELVLNDDSCLDMLRQALSRMKYYKRIVTLPNLLIEKH